MSHRYSKAAEELLDKELPVPSHGFVRLVDYLGSDASIIEAVRFSPVWVSEGSLTDHQLIDEIYRTRHTSPLEMVTLKFHIKAPIFVVRQFVRHRTASMNEESGRYSVIREEFHEPSPGDVGYQSKNNKQGRSDETIDPALVQYFSDFLKHNRQIAYAGYEAFLESNVARELARLVLPVSTYSQFYWQMNLRNLFHFLKLRLNRHAQKETRDFALQIAKCAQAVAPLAYEAFEEYHLRGAEFSREEVKYIQLLVRGEELPANAFEGKSNHRREFEEKLNFDLPAIV